MVSKITKKDALMEMVTALRDENNQVLVETVGSRRFDGYRVTNVGKDETFIPRPAGTSHDKIYDAIDAKSIKIGKNITVKKRPNGSYMVRTSKGEVVFDFFKDSDLDVVLLGALNKYETGGYPMHPIINYAHDEDLIKNAMGEFISKASKYKRAIKQMEEMGINSENMKKKMKEKFLDYSME